MAFAPPSPTASRPTTSIYVVWIVALLAVVIPAGVIPSVVVPGVVQAEEFPDPEAPGLDGVERLAALIARADLERSKNDPLRARFEQIEKGPLQLEPEVSRGSLILAQPNRVRWDFESPEAMTLLVTDTAVTTWFRDRDRVERRVLGERALRMVTLMAGGGSLAELEKRFRIRATFPADTEAPYRLELEPRSRRLALRLAGLSLTLDRQRFVPIEVTIQGADGTVTTLRLSDIEVGVELPSDTFEPAWGPDVEVVDLGSEPSGGGAP